MKVLVVDDSRAMQSIVIRSVSQLVPKGLEIQAAGSGPEALELVDRFVPDVLLTDWHMPGMTGLQMVHAMRQKGLRNMFVGFITTETQKIRVQEALGGGANFVLSKPFSDDDLRARMKPIIDRLEKGSDADEGRTARAVSSDGSGLVDIERLNMALKGIFKAKPFALTRCSVTVDQLSENNLMALYRDKQKKSLCAVSFLTTPSIILIGGAAISATEQDVRSCLKTDIPTNEMQRQGSLFLDRVASIMQAPSGDLELLKDSMVGRSFAKLQSLLARNASSSCFEITVDGVASARFGFILM